jgi:hypothetical protein
MADVAVTASGYEGCTMALASTPPRSSAAASGRMAIGEVLTNPPRRAPETRT